MCPRGPFRAAIALACVLALPAPIGLAWDETGHIIVTRVAVRALPPSMPEWLRTPEVQARLEYLSAEPDRWRGRKTSVLDHINNPDHFLDVEELTPYGLSMRNLPMLRREFLDHLAERRAREPERFGPYDRARDRDYTRRTPGLLPWTIIELQEKTASSWTTLKTFEAHRDRVTEAMIRNARENVVFHMGVLSHFVGDAVQPLHTTIHFNGWKGENPHGYTTSNRFHAYIDGDVIALHRITPEALAARARPPVQVPGRDPAQAWPRICEYIQRSFEQVEPLYALEKSGDLDRAPGKRFIEECLLEGGSMLAGIWVAAYDGTGTDSYLENKLQGTAPTTAPAGPAPTSAPAEAPSSRPASATTNSESSAALSSTRPASP